MKINILNEALKYIDIQEESHWKSFFIILGYNLYKKKSPQKIALLVPNNSFVSSLISLGVALAASDESYDNSNEVHFNFLKSLPDKTALYYKPSVNSTRGKAILVNDGSSELKAITLKNPKSKKITESKRYISVKNCSQYSVAGDVKNWEDMIINEAKVKSQKNVNSENIINAFFKNDKNFQKYLLNDLKLISIVGLKKDMELELNCELFYDCGVSEFLNLNSQNKKVEIFSERAKGVSFNSKIIIYDTSTSYIYHRITDNYQSDSHQILILDRYDNNFNEAINIWNNNFYKTDDIIGDLPKAPNSVEIAFSG